MRLILLLILTICMEASGQSPLDQKVSLSAKDISIPEALDKLTGNHDVEFAYSNRFFNSSKSVSIHVQNQPLRKVLNQLLVDTDVSYQVLDEQIVLYIDEKKTPRQFTLSGYIEDAETGERLIAAAVYSPGLSRGTISNEYGFFSLTLPETATSITTSYLGYQETITSLAPKQGQHINLRLKPALTLTEVIVTPVDAPGGLLPSANKLHQLKPEDFKSVPNLGGQSDVLRMAQSLPGIQSGADGYDGMFVRGGSGDQNLVLLDGVPVYNPYHLSGLFSIFNTSAIRSSTLLKGGFPARYGGRLSSVLDVYTKEGNSNRWSGEFGSNLISAQGTIEGPFANKKGAVLASGRHSHSDFYLLPVSEKILLADDPDFKTGYNFYDINLKFNYTLSDKDKLFLSFYRGSDFFLVNDEYIETDDFYTETSYSEAEVRWGNTILSLRWNKLHNPKLFSNSTFTYSHYKYSLGSLTEESFESADPDMDSDYYYIYLGLQSDIRDVAWKSDFDYSPNGRHYLRFGAGLSHQQFRPNLLSLYEEIEDESIFDEVDLTNFLNKDKVKNAQTLHAYLEDEFKVGKRWQFNLGMRLSSFLAESKNYVRAEPRVQSAFTLSKHFRLNASLDRTIQYLHRVKAFTINLPDDYWTASGKNIRPQTAWQGSLGVEGELGNGFSIGLEGYVKKMNHLLTLPDSVLLDDFEFDEGLEDHQFVSGKGQSRGLELLLRKSGGRTGGWLGYGLAKSTRTIDPEQEGAPIPFEYDRRHEVKLFLHHQLSKHWNASLNWMYGSPNPINPVPGLVEELPSEFTNNKIRSTAYHRLDLGLTFSAKLNRIEHQLKASAYNVYGRKNVAFYLPKGSDGEYELDPVYLFSFRPGIQYMISF